MITDDQVESAVQYIAANGDLIGQLRGQKAYLEHHIKTVLATEFLHADGTVAERDAFAKSSPAYEGLTAEYRDCVTELETLLTHFKAAELRVEVWRTQQANSRRGHV